MRSGNKALRDHAQPFISEFVEFSSTSYGGYILTVPEYLDIAGTTVAVPMTQPEKGDIVEAYLFMEMTAPSDKALNVRLGIGTFAGGNNSIVPTTAYTEEYIAKQHRKITGTDSKFNVAANGTLTIDADLTRSIPHRGDTDFLSDAFVLLITFDSLPSSANGYLLDKFKLNCSAQIGLGT